MTDGTIIPSFKIKPLAWIEEEACEGIIGAIFKAPSGKLVYVGPNPRSEWKKPFYLEGKYTFLNSRENGDMLALPWCIYAFHLNSGEWSPVSPPDREWFDKEVLGTIIERRAENARFCSPQRE